MYIEIEDHKILMYSKEYCRSILWEIKYYYKYIEGPMSGAAARTGSYQEKDNKEQLKIRTLMVPIKKYVRQRNYAINV